MGGGRAKNPNGLFLMFLNRMNGSMVTVLIGIS